MSVPFALILSSWLAEDLGCDVSELSDVEIWGNNGHPDWSDITPGAPPEVFIRYAIAGVKGIRDIEAADVGPFVQRIAEIAVALARPEGAT